MEYKLYISEYVKILNLSKYVNSFKTKVAMLCSYECSLIEPIILTELYKEDICLKYFDCGYNQIYQNCAQVNGNLYKFSPHFIIINLRLEDIFTKLFDNYLEEIQYIDKHMEEIKKYICGCVDNIRKKSDSHILFCSFCNTNIVPYSFFDSNNRYGINNIYRELNIFLTELVKKYEGFYVINVESIASYIGYKNILDNRMYKLFKNPYRIEYYIELGKAISNAILCICGKRKKCIIVDLDNTLWKGILEEDGVENLEPNIEIQKELLYLKSTGILLAINSKNEEKSAVDAMRRINGMLMDDKDFIIKKINYNRKDFNCIEIAKELNISLNSCVFLDDSQMEIDLINTNCPEIKTFKITNNIFDRHKFHNDICLDFFDLTKEDKERSSIYYAEKRRSQKKVPV